MNTIQKLALILAGCALAFLSRAGEVALQWDAVPEAASYRVYVGTSQGVYTSWQTVPSELCTVVVSGLHRATQYFFAATTINDWGLESYFSNEVTVTLPPGLEIAYLPATQRAVVTYYGTPGGVSPVLWRSSDQNTWTKVGSMTLVSAGVWRREDSGTAARRYYRARLQ